MLPSALSHRRIVDTLCSGSPPLPDLPYSSVFTGDDLTALADYVPEAGPPWQVFNGTWRLDTNYLVIVGGDEVRYAVEPCPTADCTVAVDILLGTAGGIVFRATDALNGFDVFINTTVVRARKLEAGSYTTLDTLNEAHTSGSTYRLKIVLAGDTIDVYLDDDLKLHLTGQSFNQLATLHGIFSYDFANGFQNWTVVA